MKQAMSKVYKIITLEQLLDYDREIASLYRKGEYNSPLWAEAEKKCLQVIGKIEDSIYRFSEIEVDGIEERPLFLSGQILWICAQRKQAQIDRELNDDLKLDNAIFLALKAVTCFMYCANLSNAYAITRTIETWTEIENNQYELFIEIINSLYHFPGPVIISELSNFSTEIIGFYNSLITSTSTDVETKIREEFPHLLALLQKERNNRNKIGISIPVSSLIYSFETAFKWLAKHLTIHAVDKYFGNKDSLWTTNKEAK